MDIFLASDIHSEFYRDLEFDWFFSKANLEGIDVAVLAGDILLARNSHRFIERMCERVKHVVHVAGNHEHYHGEFDSTYRSLKRTSEKLDNYYFLERDWVECDGQRFVGCTLFYNGGPNCAVNEWRMNDFRLIYHPKGYRNIIYKYASDSKHWLSENVKADDIVVTHMLPHSKCIDNNYNGDSMNEFYYNDCDAILQENKPKLWFHGHSHNPLDIVLYDTRVMRNPHGYPGERGVNWNPDFRLSV